MTPLDADRPPRLAPGPLRRRGDGPGRPERPARLRRLVPGAARRAHRGGLGRPSPRSPRPKTPRSACASARRSRACAPTWSGLLAALAAGVSAEGRCLKRPRRPADVVRAVLRPTPGWLPRLRPSDAAPAPTWISAAGAAVETIGQTASHIQTLADAQPEASSARVLGSRVAAALLADRGRAAGRPRPVPRLGRRGAALPRAPGRRLAGSPPLPPCPRPLLACLSVVLSGCVGPAAVTASGPAGADGLACALDEASARRLRRRPRRAGRLRPGPTAQAPPVGHLRHRVRRPDRLGAPPPAHRHGLGGNGRPWTARPACAPRAGRGTTPSPIVAACAR